MTSVAERTMALLPFTSQLIADVGVSLGDEGKGRLVPEIVEELRNTPRPVTVVMKVNGGANAGHTAAGVKLNLLPSGVVERDPHLAIGSGVVANRRKFLWETAPLERKGYSVLERLLTQTTLNPRSQGCKMWVTVEPKTATGGQIS